ncbi:protein sidekick-2-like isoform X2 [Ornithodoros turicata]|uniref:protein sidekick-2-like isoform X2 n=1 Tax=Ornithodoros turicata TaxID=34597 RepID=UPI003139C185
MTHLKCLLVLVVFELQCIIPRITLANAFEEKDIECYVQGQSSYSEDYYSSWDSRHRRGRPRRIQIFSSLKLCDGSNDCMDGDDESEDMCEGNVQISELQVREMNATSVQLGWSIYSLYGQPHGFLITRKVGDQLAITRLRTSTLRTYRLGNLMPLKQYTIIMRPFVNSSNGDIKVGPAVTVILDTPKLDLEVRHSPEGFEGTDVQCLDMLFRRKSITVGSGKMCDEVQDCLQGVDEMKEMCGNTLHFTVAARHTGTTKVILEWQLRDRSTFSASSMEEQRALIYGDRQGPDGLFLAVQSGTEFFNPKLDDPDGRQVTVSGLNSSTNYTFLLRPYLASGDARWGYKFGKVATLSLRTKTAEPQSVTSNYVTRLTTALLWNPARDAKFFRVKGPGGNWTVQCFPNDEDYTERNITHGFLVPVTSPNSYYRIEACAGQECSDSVMVKAGGQSDDWTPTPKISWAAATSPTSVSVRWTVPEESWKREGVSRVTEGFMVRFCKVNATSCHVAEVTSHNCTVDDLQEGTTYVIHVQAKMKTRTGRVEVGAAENARISTWTWAPAMPKLDAHHVMGSSYHLHVDWTFYNSTVSYIQVNVNLGNWNNCTKSSNCSALIHLDETVPPFTTTGSLMLWNLQSYYIYIVSVRGCNLHGCGPESNFDTMTPIEAPSAPQCITVNDCGNDTTIVQWEEPLHPGGPLDGYELTWKCDGRTSMGARVTDVKYVIEEPLVDGNCMLSLLGYHVTSNGNLLRGTAANFTLSGGHVPNICATKTNFHTTACRNISTS